MEKSRLDKLLTLLDAKNSTVRRQAALQIGDVARLHPSQLNSLLSHLRRYIKSPSSWDARMAAALALKEICRNILPIGDGTGDCTGGNGDGEVISKVINFDLHALLASDFRLLGSEGKEFDIGLMDPKSGGAQGASDRQAQRLRVAQQLGFFNPQVNDVADIVTDEDLTYSGGQAVAGRATGDRVIDDPTPPKLFKLEPGTANSSTANTEAEPKTILVNFLRSLCLDLYDPNWTARHGAALSLKEVASASQFSLLFISPSSITSQFIIPLCASDLLRCVFNVLAVDRFNDFVGEHVVAPVRETCAQLVAAILLSFRQPCLKLNEGQSRMVESAAISLTKNVLDICGAFLNHGGDPKQWECRHAGLLTVKYVIGAMQSRALLSVAKCEFIDQLWTIFHAIVATLDDSNDDVVIAAAQALLPLVDALKTVSADKIQSAIERCWQLLYKHVGVGSVDIHNAMAIEPVTLIYESGAVAGAGICDDDSAADGLFQLLESSPIPLSIDDSRLMLLLPFFSHNQPQTRQRLATVLKRSAKNGTLILSDAVWCKLFIRTFFQCLVDERFETAEYLASELWPSFVELITPEALWNLSRPILGQWLACIMISEQMPLNTVCGDVSQATVGSSENVYLGGKDISIHGEQERDRIVVGARLRGARLLAVVCNKLIDAESDQTDPKHSLTQLAALHLGTNSAYQRGAVCMFLCEWAKFLRDKQETKGIRPFFDEMKKVLECLLMPAVPTPTIYDEIIFNGSEIHSACREFLSTANVGGCDHPQISPAAIVLNAREAQEICGRALHASIERKSSTVSPAELHNRFEQLRELIKRNSTQMDRINIRASCWLACAYVRVGGIPAKFNPVVQPLMNCLKNESNQILVHEASECLALLLETATSCPSSKIVKNLSVLHSSDPKLTPALTPSISEIDQRILSWESRMGKENTAMAIDDAGATSLMARNSGSALKCIVGHFGEKLEKAFPAFYESLTKELTMEGSDTFDHCLISSTQILETVYASLPETIRERVREVQIPALCKNLRHTSSVLRHMSCRCLVAMADTDLTSTLNSMLLPCLQLLSKTSAEQNGQVAHDHSGELGGSELIYALTEKLGSNLIGVIPLLAVPILAGMSSSEPAIRPVASYTFGQLVRLMPLETDDRPLPGLSTELTTLRRKRLEFLHLLSRPEELGRQMNDGDERKKQILDSIRVNAELRSYQRDGIIWLRFLAEYGLHGILCDDMGLGKTLQTLSAMASGLVGEEGTNKRASLIICPKTLTSHWINEIRKFFNGSSETGILKATNVIDRSMAIDFSSFNVVVTSYDLFRKESSVGGSMDSILSYRWNYCILDEGHVIRNPKTRLFKTLTQLKSDHRLILSGTPVQNSVLEVWALFEFLMPGYLGTQSQFQARFGKPILLSRDAKASSAEAESGQAALENLHKLVLPFILRRRKCDVLADLPPKIIQDYPCALSSLQSQLYEDFSRAIKDRFSATTGPSGNAGGKRATGAFQILLYLRKLCDHPCLVMDDKHPNYGHITELLVGGEFGTDCRQLDDLRLSGKMVALKQLLSECGIGRQGEAEDEDEVQTTVSPHRALIFCQFKAVIGLIARYFDAGVFGQSIGYRRLDGDVPPAQRQAIVDQFNDDPSIDILLLSTQIGGLGLNLTGADVVIFVDHDWNPANDLQAMDRAHRIGQKRTVNVYRLITSGTLEEKMMRLQQFKTRTADAVIGEDNRSLMSMATDQLLDLLTLDAGSGVAGGGGAGGDSAAGRQKKHSRGGAGKKSGDGRSSESTSGYSSIDLPSLWDQSQYDEAFDYNTFINALPS